MRILCVFDKYNYGHAARGISYEYINFIPALEQLGHTVSFFETYNQALYSDFEDQNRKLLETVERVQPDLIFVQQRWNETWIETWDLLRLTQSVVLVNWAADDSWKYSQFSKYLAKYFDYFVTTYPDRVASYIKDGHDDVLLSQWAADGANLIAPKLAKDCEYQVTFVGSAHGKRKEMAEVVRAAGIDLQCFGSGWPAGPLSTEDMINVYNNSVITLNFDNGAWTPKSFLGKPDRQIKARTFEVLGYGGFLLTSSHPFLSRYYELDTEIVAFDDLQDLINKINYYLANLELRDQIAAAGYQRTANEHTYQHRLQKIITHITPLHDTYRHQPTVIDWKQFDAMVTANYQTALGGGLRWLYTKPFELMFGAVRGRRAARRLMHELSWRFRGERAYSVKSVVNRYFYNDV